MTKEEELQNRIDVLNKLLTEMTIVELLHLQALLKIMVDDCMKRQNEEGSSKKQE